jgi:DNA polymerase-3 subunit alpha
MVFPKTMAEVGLMLADDAIVLVTGRIDAREDLPKLLARSVERVDLEALTEHPPFRIKVNPDRLTDHALDELRELIVEFPGESQVIIELGGDEAVALAEAYRVDPSSSLRAELRVLFGAEAVVR